MPSHEWPRLKLTKHPGTSFYLSVNKTWLDTHTIPESSSEYSITDAITDKTNKELLKILHSLPHLRNTNLTPVTPNEHLQLIGYLWKNKSVKSEESYLQICLHELISFKENADIARFIGWMACCSIPSLIKFSVNREYDPPFLIRATLSPGQLLLPIEYYLSPHLKKTDVWKSYEQFISICSIELGLPFLHNAMDAEEEIAYILSKDFIHLSQSKSGKAWKSSMPEFEWPAFMSALSIDTAWEKRIWTITSTENIEGILRWFCSAHKERVLSILLIHLISFAAPYLRQSIKDAYNNLFNKSLLGIKNIPNEEKIMLKKIKTILPDALCNLYSKYHRDSKILTDVTELVSNLRKGAIQYMQNSSLFRKKTLVKIIEKLNRIRFIIGNSKDTPMPRVTYTPDSFIHTVCSINSARNRESMYLTGKTVDKVHSDYPCYITNASYFQESNDIFLPWGILEYPFYSNIAPLGWNHGGIGATICHEITHAFDLEGSLFTPRGQFKEWWTRKNRSSFKRQTRKVSKFYEKFKHFGKKIDGKKTLSENWADLGGLKMSLYSLNHELSEKGASQDEIKEAHRNFFISYAASWRTLSRKKALLYSMRESVHALGEDRVDRIVPQFQEWVDAFDIKEGDPLYLEPGKRLKFF